MGRREKSENMSEKQLRLRRGRRMGRRGVSCFVHRAWFRARLPNAIQNVWFRFTSCFSFFWDSHLTSPAGCPGHHRVTGNIGRCAEMASPGRWEMGVWEWRVEEWERAQRKKLKT